MLVSLALDRGRECSEMILPLICTSTAFCNNFHNTAHNWVEKYVWLLMIVRNIVASRCIWTIFAQVFLAKDPSCICERRKTRKNNKKKMRIIMRLGIAIIGVTDCIHHERKRNAKEIYICFDLQWEKNELEDVSWTSLSTWHA